MDQTPEPAIRRLVAHHGGPTALSRLLAGRVPYQRISEWADRGWASPRHIFLLKPHLPRGMKVEDLAADRERAGQEAA